MTDADEYRVVFLGGANVGITSMVERNPFDYPPEYETGLGLEYYEEPVDLSGHKINLVMFEVGKEFHFTSIEKTFQSGPRGILLMFDLTRRSTMDEVIEWHGKVVAKIGDQPTLLIGNKKDLTDDRAVTEAEGKEAATGIGANYLETSVVLNENIDRAFRTIAEMIRAGSGS